MRWSGLSIGGPNKLRVRSVLKRLKRPVEDFAPPILELEEEDGRYRIVIDCSYFVAPFAHVSKPMPQSPAALSLWLIVHNLKTHASGRKTILFASLCELLGVSLRQSPANVQDDIDAALRIVNAQLCKLPVRKLHGLKVKVPMRYRLEAYDNRVRIIGQPYPQDGDGRTLFPKPKIERERLPAKLRERLDRREKDDEEREYREEQRAFQARSLEIRERLLRDRSTV